MSERVCVLSICCLLAEQSANQRDFEKAIRFYKDALVYNENDTKVSFALCVHLKNMLSVYVS